MTDRLQEMSARHAEGLITREDVDYLLKRLHAAEQYVEALKHLAMCENKGQQFQATVDARTTAAQKMFAWEDAQ